MVGIGSPPTVKTIGVLVLFDPPLNRHRAGRVSINKARNGKLQSIGSVDLNRLANGSFRDLSRPYRLKTVEQKKAAQAAAFPNLVDNQMVWLIE